MKKEKSLIFLTVVLLMLSIFQAKASDFVPFNNIKSTGTYAQTTKIIQVEFDYKTDVNIVNNGFVLKDSAGNIISIETITALNDVGGKATRFKLELTNELDKNENYTLTFKEATIDLNLDNHIPLISYTNKVKNDVTKYDEKQEIYLVQKEDLNIFEILFNSREKFNIYDYIRLNVVDDRDGSLIDQIVIENLPNIYKVGTYEVKVSAKDSWDNTAEKVFTFKVIDNKHNSDLLINIGVGLGVILLFTGGFILFKRRK